MKREELNIEIGDVLIMWFLTLIVGAIFLVPFFSSSALLFAYFAALFSSPFLVISTIQVRYKPSFLLFQITHFVVAVLTLIVLIISNINFHLGSGWYTLYFYGIGLSVQLLWVFWLKEKVSRTADQSNELID